MKVAIFGSTFPDQLPQNELQTVAVCKILKQHSAEIYLSDTFFYSLSPGSQKKISPLCLIYDNLPKVDLALSIGGDGTFLRTANCIGDSNIPILGINTGRLGFLADVNLTDLEVTLSEIFSGNYKIEERSLLNISSDNNTFGSSHYNFGLNEVAILKQDTASMLTIRTYINDDFLTSYQADGLIVATPTGSTAYSLSVGGPILMPESPSLVLSPIAPHNLTSRPLVVHHDAIIKLKIESRSNNFLVSIDGQSQVCHANTQITIQKATFTLKVVKRTGHTFYQTLRDKLLWGVDVRK